MTEICLDLNVLNPLTFRNKLINGGRNTMLKSTRENTFQVQFISTELGFYIAIQLNFYLCRNETLKQVVLPSQFLAFH